MSSKTFKISGFPSPVTASQVTTFLEKYTFDGSIIALKLRPSRNSRAFAIVQFSKNEDAKDLILMIQQRKLYYNGSYLTIRNVEHDIIPKPREPMFVLENVKLYLGCPLSPERLSVLWSVEDVNVKFGFEMRKINFCLSYGSCLYKLELAYDSIWEIQLYRSFRQHSQFLVFQVCSILECINFFPFNSFFFDNYDACA